MQRKQSKQEALKCTHENCQQLQTTDGEFCQKHYSNKYTQKYIQQLAAAFNRQDYQATKKNLTTIIDKIYQDGFEDGANSQSYICEHTGQPTELCQHN